jgi:hypothetical protein
MEFERIGQRMRRAGIAVLAVALSAKAEMMTYASNVRSLPYSIGGLMVNDSGDPGLPQATPITSVENTTTSGPNAKTGIFPDECRCSTLPSGIGPLLSPSSFALVINSVISEVTGNGGTPGTATMPYQQASTASVPWMSLPVETETLNAGGGTFFSGATLNVASPWTATMPYQQASTASVPGLSTSVPALSNFVPEVTPDSYITSQYHNFGIFWASSIPINPVLPIVPSTSDPYLGRQLTIQGVVYQNTALPLESGVPEPASFSLISLALLGLSIWGQRRCTGLS